MDFTISYAVTACDEHEELKELLSFLCEHKREQDEVVVQCDLDNTTAAVKSVLKAFSDEIETLSYFALNKDFGAFKNNLKSLCRGDYIFQIDADELPALETVRNLYLIISANPGVDLFLVPRINTVEGITKEHVRKWDWHLSEDKWVNWPDYQPRILKNSFNIKWKNKVHETITGHSTAVQLPAEGRFSLRHHKAIAKQERQNAFYKGI